MNILRLLTPSWKFFDKIGYIAKLYYRSKSMDGNYSEWLEWPLKPQLNIGNLFINPDGNLYLAQHALIEQLLEDARQIQKNKSNKKVEDTTSYQLILNGLKKEIKSKQQVDVIEIASTFQFKITLKTFEKDEPSIEEVILSTDEGL